MDICIKTFKYDEAINTCRKWLLKNITKSYGSVHFKDILNIISPYSIPIDNLLSVQVDRKTDSDYKNKIDDIWKNVKYGKIVWVNNYKNISVIYEEGTKHDTNITTSENQINDHNFDDDLSVLFMLVKSLFLVGAIKFVYPLIEILEPIKDNFNGFIDIEYLEYYNNYNSIAATLALSNPDIPPIMLYKTPSPPKTYPELNFVGENEMIISAWRIVEIHKRDVLLRFRNVQIIDIGQMSGRSATNIDNYSFTEAVKQIDNSSYVVFSIPGRYIIKALEKETLSDIHPDSVSAARCCINWFLTRLEYFIKTKNVKPIILPALPFYENNTLYEE